MTEVTELTRPEGEALNSKEVLLNLGPQHPSTHGVIRFILHTDGEIISQCKPDVGYLHRSIEKIAERCTYNGFMPYTDRVDYVAAMNAMTPTKPSISMAP